MSESEAENDWGHFGAPGDMCALFPSSFFFFLSLSHSLVYYRDILRSTSSHGVEEDLFEKDFPSAIVIDSAQHRETRIKAEYSNLSLSHKQLLTVMNDGMRSDTRADFISFQELFSPTNSLLPSLYTALMIEVCQSRQFELL